MAARNPRWNGWMPKLKITKRTQGAAADADRREDEGLRASPPPSPHNRHQNYETNPSWLGESKHVGEGMPPLPRIDRGNREPGGMWRQVAVQRGNKTRMGRVTRQGRRFTHYRPVQIVCRFVSQAKRSVNVGQPGRAISHNAFSGALLREDENTSRRSAASRKGLIGIYPTSFRKAAVHGRNLLQPDLRPSFGHFCAGIESDSTMCGLPSVVRG